MIINKKNLLFSLIQTIQSNQKSAKLLEYKVYLIVLLRLQIEAQMKHNLDLLLQRCPTLKQISKFY